MYLTSVTYLTSNRMSTAIFRNVVDHTLQGMNGVLQPFDAFVGELKLRFQVIDSLSTNVRDERFHGDKEEHHERCGVC